MRKKLEDVMYLVLDNVVPGLPTQSISSDELKNVQRDVKDNAVEPNNTSPSPSNTLYLSKFPVGIYSEDSSNLNRT